MELDLSLFIVMFSKLATKFYFMAKDIPDAHYRASKYAYAYLKDEHREVRSVQLLAYYSNIVTDSDFQEAKRYLEKTGNDN